MDIPKKPADRPAPHPAMTIALGLLPWAAAYVGSYVLRSAIASFLLYHLLCTISAITFRRKFGPRSGKPFHHHRWLFLGASCLLVCFAAYTLTGLFGYLTEPARVLAGLRGQHVPLNKISYLLLFTYFATVNPVVEEYFWRGTIYAGLRRKHLNINQCCLIDALLFGSWHWLIVRLFFPTLFAAIITMGIVAVGLVFCQFYERTRSLPAISLLHSLGADVPVLILLWFAVLGRHGN